MPAETVPAPARSRLDGLIDRDGPHCVWCGAEPWRRDLTMEHVLPRSRGGTTVDENLVVACRRCNKARRSKPVVAYLREVAGLGREARHDTIRHALERLRSSARRQHREYGAAQLRLMDRL
jgi:5-methylcytosine-specific restriction endonuclease McrA